MRCGQRVCGPSLLRGDFSHPVQFVFDSLVLAADHRVQPRRIRAEAGDVVANLALGFTADLMVPF